MMEMNQTNEVGESESFISSGNSNKSSHLSNKSKNNILVINDSDYKSTRQAKINFSTTYLSYKEEIRLMLYKNITIYLRNIKTLIFLITAPILFLTILQVLQSLSDYYNESVVIKHHKITDLDEVNLNCLNNPYGKYYKGCLSIGIAILGLVDEKENKKINHITNFIANETNLKLGRDIDIISNSNVQGMYKYFENNLNKVQYAVAFCVDSFDIGDLNFPCKPSISNQEFNLYTIVYNISSIPNGFLDSFNSPLPSDERLLKLKILVENAYLDYYTRSRSYSKSFNHNDFNFDSKLFINTTNSSNPQYRHSEIPKIQKISTQAYPSPPSRFSSNANVISLFGVFYLYFPPMILFSIILLDLVKEKESKLKNYSNIYGLSLIGYWVSWSIVSIGFSLIIALEFCMFGKFIFHYDVFDNANIIIPFLLFFLFTFTMQSFAMYLSCCINSTKTATTISYSIILVGIVVQLFFTNYGIVYFFYATNLESLNFLVKMILLILHFYPPFLFSKSYLNIYRICSYHFDSPKLQWVPGRYFELKDIFEKEIGKLRIGVEFEVESLFVTFLWFLFLIIFFMWLLAISEMKENYKYSENNKEPKLLNLYNIFRNFNIFDCFRLIKDLSTITSLKRLNIKKQKLEDSINKNFDKFIKNEQKSSHSNSSNFNLNDENQNLSFIVTDNHISVTNEKKLVATLNKKGMIPNGIRIMSVSKTYQNGLKALNDINIEISKDEVFTILGPNGAGKSTLINILSSQISSSEGFAKVGPFMIHSDLFIDSVYLKRMIGICSQFDYFWEELTIYETLFVYSRLRGINLNKIEKYIDQKISEVGLEGKKFEKVSKLSGGMRRRLSICISTLGDPFIIFMDEPTSGLDPNNRRKIWKLINSIKKNRVIILTTHIMEEAEYLSDRLGVIIGGKLRFIGNCTEMRKIFWDGIILTLTVDKTNLDKLFYIFDDNIKYLFIHSQINYSSSGIYQILIKNDNKRDLVKAFEIFKRKSNDKRIIELFDYLKDVCISQANIESIYLDLCKKYK